MLCSTFFFFFQAVNGTEPNLPLGEVVGSIQISLKSIQNGYQLTDSDSFIIF